MNSTPNSSLPKGTSAFTLIELLVVIGVIAILTAIALPAYSMVQKSGYRTKCLSNFRQIGTSIGSYMGDHDGSLPGPLWNFQDCWYDQNDYGALGSLLAPYLRLPLDYEKRKAEILVCPAWQQRAPYLDDALYAVNTDVKVEDRSVNPWGSADLYEKEGVTPDNADLVSPKKLASMVDVNPAKTWAIQELDALSTMPKVPKGVAPQPVHGDVRNTLFLDFHVEAIRVGTVLTQ